MACLLGVPLALIAYKHSGLPGSAELAQVLSFEQLPHEMQGRTHHLLFAPVGALIVVLFRLTLGIRVLGPFRSVLLAIAFQVTGIGVGLWFFALVIAVVFLLRPVFKRMKLAFFGRSAAMLSSVAGMIVLAVLAGLALGLRDVERVAYFPVVVLTLTGEAFATAWRREGAKAATWRAGATAGVAVLITGLSSVKALQTALVQYPELLLMVLAGVVITSKVLNLRLLQHLNPAPVRKKKRKPVDSGAGAKAGAAGGAGASVTTAAAPVTVPVALNGKAEGAGV